MGDLITVTTATFYRPDGRRIERACPIPLGYGDVARSDRRRRSSVEYATAALWPLCQRIAPWVVLIVCPRIVDEFGTEIYGTYWADRIAISLRRDPIGTILHELWHAVEVRLPDDLIAAIGADLGPSLIADDGWYWSDPEEKRARAFSAWAMRHVEGLPGYIATSDLDAVFSDAWSGALGRELA